MTAEFFLVTDRAYSTMDEAKAKEICGEFLPADFSPVVKIVKRTPDAEMIKTRIFEYVRKAFPAACAFLGYENIEVETLSSGAHFYVDIASGEQTLFESGKILDEVSRYLMSVFCGTFYGNVRIVEKDARDESLLDEIPESKEETGIEEIRTFPICEYVKIDGFDTPLKTAVYIADCAMQEGVFSVCGAVQYIEEISYKRHNEKTGEDVEKTRFSVTVNDGTGALRTTYFPKKATVEKVREIKIGDKIIITGTNEEYNGSRSFKASKLNYGQPPEDFEPVARKGKPVPKFYHTVFPEPYVDYTQTGLFDDLSKPDDLKNNVFVCFDLETTGLNNNPAMGKMDRIIEIGAVKIIDGEIKEKFSSFVACPERLSKEIIDLTGIHDKDLVGAPEVEKVIADFYKFIDGAILVGHNVTFDYRFVKYYGEQNGYMFDKKQYDTLTLAQDVLRGQLANYKLNTVADHYGFSFNHHRAFDDACVTAKVFMELVKAKGKLD
jgi:DNA polymerase III epsilon subunit family exonuclease